MNIRLHNQINTVNILATLNKNIIEDDIKKDEALTMGISSCQVACMSYKCCTGHGRGGKHIEHSYKI